MRRATTSRRPVWPRGTTSRGLAAPPATVTSLYNNIPCISCDVTAGNTIGVATATRTPGIDFALTPAAILVADSPLEGLTGRILKVSADGSSVAVFANTGGCPTKMARRPSGNILAVDPCNSRVLEITPAGGISTLPSPGIQVPYAIAIEPNSGNIFVADNFADVIYRITPGGAVSQFAVIPGGSPFTLQNISLAVSGLDVIAAYDDYNGVSGQTAIIKIGPTGTPITTLFQGTAIGSMGGLALESSGTFVIPDGAHNRLIRFNPVGSTITPIATDPVALCCDLLGVTIDSAGNFIVAVNSQNRLVRITPAGVITLRDHEFSAQKVSCAADVSVTCRSATDIYDAAPRRPVHPHGDRVRPDGTDSVHVAEAGRAAFLRRRHRCVVGLAGAPRRAQADSAAGAPSRHASCRLVDRHVAARG